jgi:hypothetical protein
MNENNINWNDWNNEENEENIELIFDLDNKSYPVSFDKFKIYDKVKFIYNNQSYYATIINIEYNKDEFNETNLNITFNFNDFSYLWKWNYSKYKQDNIFENIICIFDILRNNYNCIFDFDGEFSIKHKMT